MLWLGLFFRTRISTFISRKKLPRSALIRTTIEQFAWADIDNMYVSVRDGDFRMFGALYYRNRGMASNGRLHVHERQLRSCRSDRHQLTDSGMKITTSGTHKSTGIFMSGSGANVGPGRRRRWQAKLRLLLISRASEPVNRDNFEVDNPYSSYPELHDLKVRQIFYGFQYDPRRIWQQQTFEVELPADFTGSTVLDLVTGTNVPVVNGKVTDFAQIGDGAEIDIRISSSPRSRSTLILSMRLQATAMSASPGKRLPAGKRTRLNVRKRKTALMRLSQQE